MNEYLVEYNNDKSTRILATHYVDGGCFTEFFIVAKDGPDIERESVAMFKSDSVVMIKQVG